MYNTYTYGGSTLSSSDAVIAAGLFDSAGIWGIIALILAIIGGILVYFLFIRQKNSPKNKFAKWLKDFLSFKIMWIEVILKIAYYVATIFIILFSFSFFGMTNIFGGAAVLMFFLCLILGPIVIRLAYEAGMMFIMIWRNTQDISDHTKKK